MGKGEETKELVKYVIDKLMNCILDVIGKIDNIIYTVEQVKVELEKLEDRLVEVTAKLEDLSDGQLDLIGKDLDIIKILMRLWFVLGQAKVMLDVASDTAKLVGKLTVGDMFCSECELARFAEIKISKRDVIGAIKELEEELEDEE